MSTRNVNWRGLLFLLCLVGVAAAAIHYAIFPPESPRVLSSTVTWGELIKEVPREAGTWWGYLSTGAAAAFFFFLVLERRLWRWRILGFRVFKWITHQPDLVGNWHATMESDWKNGEPFDAEVTIKQSLLSIRINMDLKRSKNYNLSADLHPRAADEALWTLYYVYENERVTRPENKSNRHTIDHDGCMKIDISVDKTGIPKEEMSGKYWTNKAAVLSLAEWPRDRLSFKDGLLFQATEEQIEQLAQWQLKIVATSGTITIRKK